MQDAISWCQADSLGFKMCELRAKDFELQGSCMSSLLCSLYLADLESKHLVPLLPDLLTASNQSTSSGPNISDLANLAGSLYGRHAEMFGVC